MITEQMSEAMKRTVFKNITFESNAPVTITKPPPPQPRPFVPWTEEQMRDGILGMINERVHATGQRLKESPMYHTAQYTEQAERDLSNWQRLLAYAKEKLK
jgi:hypothetical protein